MIIYLLTKQKSPINTRLTGARQFDGFITNEMKSSTILHTKVDIFVISIPHIHIVFDDSM